MIVLLMTKDVSTTLTARFQTLMLLPFRSSGIYTAMTRPLSFLLAKSCRS